MKQSCIIIIKTIKKYIIYKHKNSIIYIYKDPKIIIIIINNNYK